MKILNFIKISFITLIILILCGIIFANVTMYVQKNIYKENNPNVFGFSTAVVVSGSMSPAINTNDMIVIQKQNDYKLNDIISFNTGKSIVTHRITEVKDEGGFITKGDANNVDDQNIITPDMILGKVIFIIPGIGNLIAYMQSPLGLFLIALFAFMIIIIPTKSKEENSEIDDVQKINN